MTEKGMPTTLYERIQQRKLDSGLQPFKLVKYFTFSSLAVILVFTLVLSWIISNNARKVMLTQSEEYSMVLAENLNQQVFRRFVLPTVVRYGNIALSNKEQFEFLDRIVKNMIQGMKIESVTIYDSRINIISYSTERELVGKRNMGGMEYKKSLRGIANSKLQYSGSPLSFLPITTPPRCELRTFIPFRQVRESSQGDEAIMGVVEIQKDLSKEYSKIIGLQSSIIAVSGTVMMVLFLVLRIIVSRADKIMESRNLERLRLEEKLNQAERLAHLGRMVATVSHEIKSPLGIVRSTAEILEKRIKKVAPGSEHLSRIIVDETTRLNHIVMEFLDFARPQEPKLNPGNVNDVLSKVLKFMAPQALENNVELISDLQPELPMVPLDQDLLYRAFLNILVNGMQAIQEEGELRVTTRTSSGSTIVITVMDTGIGMSEEKIGQIFKPFFTDKHKGTGLGLAITKNIIDSHNGSIKVESVSNEGTTFTITLSEI